MQQIPCPICPISSWFYGHPLLHYIAIKTRIWLVSKKGCSFFHFFTSGSQTARRSHKKLDNWFSTAVLHEIEKPIFFVWVYYTTYTLHTAIATLDCIKKWEAEKIPSRVWETKVISWFLRRLRLALRQRPSTMFDFHISTGIFGKSCNTQTNRSIASGKYYSYFEFRKFIHNFLR